MHPRRLARLNELILQTVSRAALELKDPRLGFVTMTGADIAPDLSLARIYYSVLGTNVEREETAKALESAIPRFRRDIAKLENLRKVPHLTFLYDDSAERAARVHQLLNTIEKEHKDDGPTSAD